MISQIRKEANHSVAILCQLFEVSQSGYFSFLSRPPSPRSQRRQNFTQKIQALFHQHQHRYGRPRIYRHLKTQGEHVSEKMVGSILRAEGLRARRKKPFRPKTTLTSHSARFVPNLLKQQPLPTRANQVLVSDITYVATQEGWLYLAAIMDLKTKVIKGYQIDERMPAELVCDALKNALQKYPHIRGAILHSDRGCQYTSQLYLQTLKHHQLQASMSETGNCYDNAAMESFWATLKTECFPHSGVFETKEAARQEIFEYIEGYYHSLRIHSSLEYRTPLAAELDAH